MDIHEIHTDRKWTHDPLSKCKMECIQKEKCKNDKMSKKGLMSESGALERLQNLDFM